MTLLVILICLALERFTPVGAMIHRFNWLPLYLQKLEQTFAQQSIWKSSGALAIIILPILIVTALVYYTFASASHGLVAFIIDIIIVFYCLGSFRDEAAEVTSTDAKKTFHISESLSLWQANERIFAVLFWFAIAGPVGAVLYRVSTLLKDIQPVDEASAHFHKASVMLQGVLDWLPARIFSFCFALVGDFSHTFNYWLDQIFTSWQTNKNFLLTCGKLSLHLQSDLQDDTVLPEVSGLIDRTLIVFLVIVALFTIGSWLYFV